MARRTNNNNKTREQIKEDTLSKWVPKTTLGQKVKNGEITSLEEIYKADLPILEPEIIDTLVPNLQEELLQLKTVQRTTGSGRKMAFFVVMAVGDKNGHIGVGTGKGLEVRPTIERAVRNAKKNLIHIRRGCGSWECNCNENHSLPFKVQAKFGSTTVILKPAPKGAGRVVGKVGKKVLELAGITDVWSQTKGPTDTVMNNAQATMHALQQTRKMKLKREVGSV